jgi:hypothetical protein
VAWPVDALAVLGDQTLKPHPARSLEQLGTDLALLERRHEDAVCTENLIRVADVMESPKLAE